MSIDTNDWDAWCDAHRMRYYDPYHDLRLVLARMDTVANLAGVPDRTEFDRWRGTLQAIATQFDANTTWVEPSRKRWWKR
jgi:hypothetical protein